MLRLGQLENISILSLLFLSKDINNIASYKLSSYNRLIQWINVITSNYWEPLMCFSKLVCSMYYFKLNYQNEGITFLLFYQFPLIILIFILFCQSSKNQIPVNGTFAALCFSLFMLMKSCEDTVKSKWIHLFSKNYHTKIFIWNCPFYYLSNNL